MSNKYRKKPVVIEAILWYGTNQDAIVAFVSPANLRWKYYHNGVIRSLQVWHDQEDQWINCPDGHWIIRGIRGEYYPCAAAIFDETYEKVSN